MSAREQACGPQDYYTKAELVKEFSNYNVESSKIGKFEGDGSYKISSFIDVTTDPDPTVRRKCSETHEHDQHSNGCFYSGLVRLEADNKSPVSLMLADTSDYTDVKILPKLSEYFSFFGLRGSISWNSGQTDWFEKYLDDSDQLRIISSHYPVTNLLLTWVGLDFMLVGRMT